MQQTFLVPSRSLPTNRIAKYQDNEQRMFCTIRQSDYYEQFSTLLFQRESGL